VVGIWLRWGWLHAADSLYFELKRRNPQSVNRTLEMNATTVQFCHNYVTASATEVLTYEESMRRFFPCLSFFYHRVVAFMSETESTQEASLIDELDERQDDVLSQLDNLCQQVEALLESCTVVRSEEGESDYEFA